MSGSRMRAGVTIGVVAGKLLFSVASLASQECAGLPPSSLGITATVERTSTGRGMSSGGRLGYQPPGALTFSVAAARLEFEPVTSWRWDERSWEPIAEVIAVEPGFLLGAEAVLEAFALGLPICTVVGIQHARFGPLPSPGPHHWQQGESPATLLTVGSGVGRSFFTGRWLVINPFAGLQAALVHGLEGYHVTLYPDASAHLGMRVVTGPLHWGATARRWITGDPVFATPTRYFLGPYSPEESAAGLVVTIQAGFIL
jgi:hypothetical protein